MSFRHFRLAGRIDREALWHFRARSQRCQPHAPASDIPEISTDRPASPNLNAERWHLIIKIGLKRQTAT